MATLFWLLLYQRALPWNREYLLTTSWWSHTRTAQKLILYDLGFTRTTPDMDIVTADVFTWLCLAAPAHGLGSLLAFPLAILGWRNVGDGSHQLFLFATVLFLGWVVFNLADASLRRFAYASFPAGISGMKWACPQSMWVAVSLLYAPFWLLFIVPMNFYQLDLGAYHAFFCLHLFGLCLEFAARCHQHNSLSMLPRRS